jgi:formamidopyrimidine-DNA glycosylase
MPELPDVEAFRQYVDATALHKQVERVAQLDDSLLHDVSERTLRSALKNASLEQTRRHGKHLGARLTSGRWLLLHFGMTGALDYAQTEKTPPDHSRLVLYFGNGYRLAYLNQRKLGAIRLVDEFDSFVANEKLGPDALQVEREPFVKLFEGGRGSIKTRLMNQNVLAGLGNVYTDELFFQVGIHPGSAVNAVATEQAAEMWREMRRILRVAIDRQGEPGALPDGWLLPHRIGLGDGQCPRGHGSLEQESVGGRTAQCCAKCQPHA